MTLLTLKEAAAHLRVSVRTVEREAADAGRNAIMLLRVLLAAPVAQPAGTPQYYAGRERTQPQAEPKDTDSLSQGQSAHTPDADNPPVMAGGFGALASADVEAILSRIHFETDHEFERWAHARIAALEAERNELRKLLPATDR